MVFRSDFLPLASFADSAAIQLINSHAIVPSTPPPPNGTAPMAEGAAPAPAPSTAPQSLAATPQSVGSRDPWSPRS